LNRLSLTAENAEVAKKTRWRILMLEEFEQEYAVLKNKVRDLREYL
jgi:hypothetical protein